MKTNIKVLKVGHCTVGWMILKLNNHDMIMGRHCPSVEELKMYPLPSLVVLPAPLVMDFFQLVVPLPAGCSSMRKACMMHSKTCIYGDGVEEPSPHHTYLWALSVIMRVSKKSVTRVSEGGTRRPEGTSYATGEERDAA